MMAGLSREVRAGGTARQGLLRWGLVGLLLLPLALGGYPLYLATEAALLGLAAVALSLLLGHGGVPSLGQAVFLGLGAYTVGLALKAGLPLGLALLLAPLAAALLALLTGLLVFRTHGIFILMLTLAFGQMVYSAAHKWTGLTGGDDGLSLSGLSIHPVLLHLVAVGVLLAVADPVWQDPRGHPAERGKNPLPGGAHLLLQALLVPAHRRAHRPGWQRAGPAPQLHQPPRPLLADLGHPDGHGAAGRQPGPLGGGLWSFALHLRAGLGQLVYRSVGVVCG